MVEDENSISSPGENSTATINLNLQSFVCSVCGEDHETENCAVVQTLKSVHDSKILSRARQTLPENLEVKTLADGSTTVFTNIRIEQGTQFGPFQAPFSLDLPPSVLFPLKVFGKSLDEGYYLDTTDEESCNWMCLVAAATTTKEQNLICYDVKQGIYFATTRDIQPGEELRLWYALYYGLKLQALPLADDSTHEVGFYDFNKDEVEERIKPGNEANIAFGEDLLQTLTQHLPAHALGASGERDVWLCKLCGQRETNVASYARHLMTHYHPPANDSRQLQCQICSKRFISRKMFEKHQLKNHCLESEPSSSSLIHISFENLKSDKEHLLQITSVESVEGLDPAKNQEKPSVYEDQREAAALNCDGAIKTSEQCGDSRNITRKDCVLEHDPKCNGEKRRDYNGKPVDCIDPRSPLTAAFDSANYERSADVGPFQIPEILESMDIKLDDHFQVDRKEKVMIHSSNGDSFSTSFEFSGAQDLDVALENGEPITFVVVESSEGNEAAALGVNDNIIVNTGSTLESCDDNSLPVPQDHEVPDIISSELYNKNTQVKKKLPFNCDICQKSFGKCSYLYRHLRKHTGEFTCVACLAVFARKENLKTHSCSQPKEWFPCPTCGKKFTAKKYLQRHSPMHTGEYTCSDCKRHFVSRLSLKFHRCSNNKHAGGTSALSCFMCERVFGSEAKVKSHLKVHAGINPGSKKINASRSLVSKSQNTQLSDVRGEEDNNASTQNETEEGKVLICEICGAIFKSYSSLKMHRFRHGEKKFECTTCKKRFHRKDVLQEHLKVHEEANFPCQICGKKYKTKKSLNVHSRIHEGLKRFSCGVCSKTFFQKGNLGKHMQTHTSDKMYTCRFCSKSFSSKEYFSIHELTHTQGKIFRCHACERSFVKQHLLDTHRLLFHSNRGFLCKFCNTVIRHRHSVRRHLEKTHSEFRHEWSEPGFIDFMMTEIPEDLLHLAGDVKLAPQKQQERQQQLELFRKKHFHSSVDAESSSDLVYSPVSSSDPKTSPLGQGDPLILLEQPPQQFALIENLLPDLEQAQLSAPSCQSLLVSENGQGPDGEILLTLVNPETLNSSSKNSTTPFLSSAVLGNNVVGLDSGATYLMDDGNGSNSVLLYIVETSNGENGDPEDLVWCNEPVDEQL